MKPSERARQIAGTIDRAYERVCADGQPRVVCYRDVDDGRRVVIWPADEVDGPEWDAFNCLWLAEVSVVDGEVMVDLG